MPHNLGQFTGPSQHTHPDRLDPFLTGTIVQFLQCAMANLLKLFLHCRLRHACADSEQSGYRQGVKPSLASTRAARRVYDAKTEIERKTMRFSHGPRTS